jgi:Ca-activated chloride channel homolog
MDWEHPYYLLLLLPAAAALWWFDRRSLRPLSPPRRRTLLAVRAAMVLLVIVALAGPAAQRSSQSQAVIFVLDHSQSQGDSGRTAAYEEVQRLAAGLPGGTPVGFVSAGSHAQVLAQPGSGVKPPRPEPSLMAADGSQTDLASAVALAAALFPPGQSKHMVLVGDGEETTGDLASAAREAALHGVTIDALPVAGQQRPDVRVVRLVSSKSVSHEGASFDLRADVESSLAGKGRLRLFENGIEVESRDLTLAVGDQVSQVFHRAPENRRLYTYTVRAEGFNGDAIPENNEAMALVDVRGRPILLYVEGEPEEARYLADAMAKEGIRLQVRSPESFPQTLQELAGYDGIVLSDVPAHKFSERSMAMVRDYVERLGGGFCMIGGKNSFGAGGYYRTPIEDVLPVKMKAPDKEERFATALAFVLDRSGSMQGEKIEICKSASIATIELLSAKDFVGLVAFDSEPHWVVPMTSAAGKAAINAQISTINAGGGTNIYPAMVTAREALAGTRAKVKHMIVLTDGVTDGSGYNELAAAIRNDGMTVSTVAVGNDADTALLQAMAAAGGGQYYASFDPANLPRIFTQDAMTHIGRLIREESFKPRQSERHPMLAGCPIDQAPMLLGYVKTHRKATAQVPLVTDQGDPLLAHWQFGLGKVTAFTSDAKSRWAALWISAWPGYGQFWAQVFRETARKPQSQFMDVRLEEQGSSERISVDLLEDAAHFKNEADVKASVYFVAAGAAGSAMQPLEEVRLDQTGPGRYEGRFQPQEPGLYFVQARAGAQLVSAGIVHNVEGEAVNGRVNLALFERVCKSAGGRVLVSGDQLSPPAAAESIYVEIAPILLRIALVLFVFDVAIRRWENIQGMLAMVRGG